MKITVRNTDGRLGTGVSAIEYTTQKDGGVSKTVKAATPVRKEPTVSTTGKAKRDTTTTTMNRVEGLPSARAPSVPTLQNQLRQATVDQDTDVILRLNKQLKEERARQGKQTVGDRVSDVASAAFGGFGGSLANLAGLAGNLFQDPEADRRNISRLQESLRTGRTTDGKTITDTQRKAIEDAIARLDASAAKKEASDSFTNQAYRAADRMADTGAAFQESAKAGLGKVGSTIVDAATSMGQSTLDAALGAATGTGMLPFVARSLGGSAQEARRSGADLSQQLVYGSAQAAKEYVSEKLFGLAAPQRLIGGGSFDDAIEAGIKKATERLAKTPGGQKLVGGLMTWLAGGATEAFEEGFGSVIENALINPVVRTWDPDQRSVEEKISDGLYDMLVGGVSGLMGVTNLAQYQVSPQTNTQTAQIRTETAPETTLEAGREQAGPSAKAAQGKSQAASRDILMEAAARGGKLGPEVDIQKELERFLPTEAQQKAAPEAGAAVVADTSLFDRGILGNLNKARSYFVDYAKKHFPASVINTETGKSIGISRNGIDKFLSGRISAEKYASGFHIPELIERAYKVGDAANYHQKTAENIPTFEYYDSPIQINGKEYTAHIRVKNSLVGDKYYGHTISEVDSIEIEPPARASSPETPAGQSVNAIGDPIDPTIQQSAPEVKGDGMDRDDGLGAANAGFTTLGMEGQERTSRLAESMPYNETQAAATGMTREEYDRQFRYQSQTEAKTTHLAEELVYVMKDGKKTFLKDVDEAAYQALTESLREATAWNAEQSDAATMILNELAGKSVNMDIVSEEYTEWMNTVREHQTAGGQGIQAIAKWTRENKTGFASEQEALKNLEKSGLSKEEQGRIYSRIVQMDGRINAVQEGDTSSMKSIILETAADRGLIRGKWGDLLSLWASRALDAMSFDQMKQFAFSSTAAMSSDTVKADFGQMVKTCQVLSMLSNKATVARNLVGNASFYGVDAMAMDGAALLDMAVSKATGTRSVAMEQASLKEAVRAAWISQAEVLLDVDMGGEKTRYGTGSNRTFKAGSKHAVARFLSALERNQSLYLTVPDEFFKGMARGTASATQKLIDQGKIKTDNANYAAEQAGALAKYRTFQDDTKIANAIQQVHDICNMLLGFGDSGRTVGGHKVHSFGIGDFVAAFTKVAGNLATRGIEYSPHNAVKGTLELASQIYNAKTGKAVDAAKQAKGVSNVARGLTGAAIACVFRGLIRAGVLRLADDDDDKDVAALNRSEGLSGVQLNLSAAYRWLRGDKNTDPQSGDTLIDASSLEPLNQLMYAAAYLEKGQSWVSAYPSAALSSAAELPVLDTVGNIGKRVYKYGENIADVTAEELGQSAVSSVLPNAMRAIAKGIDDRSRNSSVNFDDVEEEDPVKRFFKIMKEAAGKQAVTSTPILRETLPGGVSPTGEEKTYPTTRLWNLMNAVANPLGVNTYTQSEQSKEWQRLREETGRTDFYPSSTIPKTIKGGGKEKKFSYEERQDFQRERGLWLMPTTMEMMGTAGYRSAGGEQQSDLMEDVRDFSHDAAKISVLGTDSAPKWVSKAIEAQRDTGLSPATVIYYRDMLSRLKESLKDSEANQAVRNAIFGDQSMTAAQKNALDDLMITDGFYITQEKNVDYSGEDSFRVSQLSDSAVKHWDLVHENMPGISGKQYATAWEISNRKKPDGNGYSKEEKIRFLREELNLPNAEARRIYSLMEKVIED